MIWNNFLSRMKNEIQPINFETWFEDTKLIGIENNIAKVLVPMPLYKKHLKEAYGQLISKIFNEVTESNFLIDYITEDELENNIIIDSEKWEGIPSNIVNFETNLDPKYTFENFLIGKSNKFAKVNALAIAERPGQLYNPLFIYGPSGVGKTHLMHAIGNYITKNSNNKVLYVTTEKFVNDFLKIYKDKKDSDNFNTVDEFKNKYRDVDVLIIDDIQYFEVASKTQQEFFNTFNELHSKNKQIIISSDRSPNDLKKLEDRLRTRFAWGLSVDILPPDFDLRMNIINNKTSDLNINFPEDVKEYIASICTTDVRKLEGCITRVMSYAAIMNGSNIDLELTQEALIGFIGKQTFSKNKINQVQQIVAQKYNLTVDDLKGKRRRADIVFPRQIAMYICNSYLNESFAKIGSEFGGKDHTTVMHSVNKIKSEIKKNKDLSNEIDIIISQVR